MIDPLNDTRNFQGWLEVYASDLGMCLGRQNHVSIELVLLDGNVVGVLCFSSTLLHSCHVWLLLTENFLLIGFSSLVILLTEGDDALNFSNCIWVDSSIVDRKLRQNVVVETVEEAKSQ